MFDHKKCDVVEVLARLPGVSLASDKKTGPTDTKIKTAFQDQVE
jgi:hypothetical protein